MGSCSWLLTPRSRGSEGSSSESAIRSSPARSPSTPTRPGASGSSPSASLAFGKRMDHAAGCVCASGLPFEGEVGCRTASRPGDLEFPTEKRSNTEKITLDRSCATSHSQDRCWAWHGSGCRGLPVKPCPTGYLRGPCHEEIGRAHV